MFHIHLLKQLETLDVDIVIMIMHKYIVLFYLETESKKPLRLPKQEQATNSGMTHAMMPNMRSANV